MLLSLFLSLLLSPSIFLSMSPQMELTEVAGICVVKEMQDPLALGFFSKAKGLHVSYSLPATDWYCRLYCTPQSQVENPCSETKSLTPPQYFHANIKGLVVSIIPQPQQYAWLEETNGRPLLSDPGLFTSVYSPPQLPRHTTLNLVLV